MQTHVAEPIADIDRKIFGLLFEHTSEAAFAVSRTDLRIVSANSRLEDLTGRSRAILVGQPAANLFLPNDECDANALANRVIGRQGLHDEIAIARIDGYPVTVALTVAHVEHENTGPIAACIARDITERQMLERELISKHLALFTAHSELEKAVSDLELRNRELAEKNQELRVMGVRLSQASRRALIGELSAGIAHSLNNPLAALVSAHRQLDRLIAEKGSDELKDGASRFLKRGSDTASRMETIIQAVRRAHRSGNTATEPESLALNHEIEVALALFEPRLGSIEVVTSIGDGMSAWVSAADFQHILWNLMDNAVLAMPGGGCLRIEATPSEVGVTVAVHDSGEGIAPDRRKALFEPFVTTRPDGSGLGLVTARRLARQSGGDVSFSPSDSGARFEIHLPTKESHAA